MLLKSLPIQVREQDYHGIFKLCAVFGLLLLATFPYFFRESIENALIQYAIQRYDPAIEAIERYRNDHGYYPSTLKELVPNYLQAEPRIFMKFGETLKYDPNSAWGYAGYGPFTFELDGTYNGIHGLTLKYCPIEDETCERFKRVNNRWVWIYSSAL